ncbi:UNVERIFIED_CONTAM: response regulator, partial [Microbacterium sp. SLM126]
MPDDHRDTRPAPQASPLVLVVDDNPVTRYATVRVLTAAGYRTIEAESGQEALQRADLSVSAVVLDVNLPDIDGFQVCRSLRSRPETATVPVVHLSATYVADYDKVRGLDAGASAYLIHPAEPGVLVATIASLLRASAAERSMRESEARFRAIYHQAIGGICTLDLAGRFVDVNPAMLTMLGRPEAALVGQPVAAFAPPEFREKVAEATGHTGQTGWQGTFPLCDARGETMHLEWSISAVLETGVKVAVVSNITDHVNLERQREQLIEREQAARAAVAGALNLDADDVVIHERFLGGGFGRRLEVDYVAQAAAIAARAPGKAVQTIWSRPQDMAHDFYRPACVSRFSGVLDDKGNLVAWRAASASQSVSGQALARTYGLPRAIARVLPDATMAEGAFD